MPKKNKDPFEGLTKTATGLAGLGVTSAVGATTTSRAISQLPAGTQVHFAPMQNAFGTIAGFAPIGVTAMAGKSVLNVLPKQKGVKIKGKRVI